MCSLLYWRRFFLKPSIVRKSVCFVFQDFGQQWNSIFTTRHIYKFEGIKYFVRILIFSDTNFHYSRTSRHRQLSNTDTSLLRTVSHVPTKFSYIFFKHKPLQYGLSLMRTTDTKSRPQWVNSYKLNLFITDTAQIRWIRLHRVNPV